MKGCGIISPPLIPLDVLPFFDEAFEGEALLLEEELATFRRYLDLSAGVIRWPFGNANHPRTATSLDTFGKPPSGSLQSDFSNFQNVPQRGETSNLSFGRMRAVKKGGKQKNESRFIQVYDLCPLALIQRRGKTAGRTRADYSQAYPMIFRLFCNAATRLLTCRSSDVNARSPSLRTFHTRTAGVQASYGFLDRSDI
ncbi:hypothetical protein QQF64_001849 [Cirrhinus molitorella]|uniref:Uncharacterized protein n=1 Tax=Cirrhinus molitorella TaxID=172907 RepID=A0ABR3MNG5_9TELE